MSQNVVDFSQNPTGPELMDDFLAKVQENLKTCNSGISRPSYAVKGTFWLDTSVTPHLLKQYDGSDDVVLGSVDVTNHVFTPNSPLLTNGGTDKYVLTANGVGNAPTYQKNPIGVYEYSSSRTYGLNDFVMQYDSTDEKVKLYRSIVADNLNNPLSDTSKWEEVSLGGGSGLEIGDIGIAPLGIDEAENKRRYLNGQVISQAQFVSFTDKLKSIVALYPSLATDEVNWQAEVTNSALGQCGKFVIDDDAGTIRLPKVVNINGLQDLSVLGGIKEAGLPSFSYNYPANHTGNPNGALDSYGGAVDNRNYWRGWRNNGIYTDSIYGNSTTVQQEAVQYPYFIQVAEGVETSIDVSREIELNNPFSLLDYKYSEYILDNASWLLSNGQFNSGSVYQSVYDLLLQIYNGTVTKAGVSVKLSTETYTDTDFVVNTTDTTFRLPLKVALASGKAVAGNGMTLGLTNGTGNAGLVSGNASYTNQQTGAYGQSVSTSTSSGSNIQGCLGITTDETKSGIETSANGLYLYFYVGEVVQDANIIAAAGVLTDIADLKAHSIVETYVNGTSWYRVYSDGWCEQGGKALITGGTSQVQTQVGLIKAYSSSDYQVLTQSLNTSNTCWDRVISQTTSSFNVLIDYSNPTYTPNHYVYWQACGYIS